MTGSATPDTFSSCHRSILLFLWDELLGRLGFLGVIGSAIASIIVATGGVIIEGITSAVRCNLSSAGWHASSYLPPVWILDPVRVPSIGYRN